MNSFRNTVSPKLLTTEHFNSLDLDRLKPGIHYFAEIVTAPDNVQYVIKHQGTAQYLKESRSTLNRQWMTREEFLAKNFSLLRKTQRIVVTGTGMRPIDQYPVAEEVIGSAVVMGRKQTAFKKGRVSVIANTERLTEVPYHMRRDNLFSHLVR